MLAEMRQEVPKGNYFYEPKWDGLRAIVFRDGREIVIQSRNQKMLERSFPELVTGLRRRLPKRCVVDGEIVVASAGGLDFDALSTRIHPAAARVDELSRAHPASFIAFDLLALGSKDLRSMPMVRRRAALEKALSKSEPPLYVTPATTDWELARSWFARFDGAGIDGVVCKPFELPYVEGERVMFKVRHQQTAECVVGGYRPSRDGEGPSTLLLGLYADTGRLQQVGVAVGMDAKTRAQLAELLAPLRGAEGHAWTLERALEGREAWELVSPRVVVEVDYDHLQHYKFRNITRFVRLRPDREARSCTFAQLTRSPPVELTRMLGQAAAGHPA
jgi:ATP-dependent DNA ligase